MSKHTLSQIENCLDFAHRSQSSLGSYASAVVDEAKYLETKIAPNVKKLLVKAHAKHLMAEAEAESEKRRRAIQERADLLASATVAQGKKKTSTVKLESLYELLYDHNGRSKAENLN